MKHTKPEQVIINDQIWYDGDLAVDAKGDVWQLKYTESLKMWHWFTFGTEYDFTLDDEECPAKPFRKAVLHTLPVAEEVDL